jgi:protoporphyrinogen oxidase
LSEKILLSSGPESRAKKKDSKGQVERVKRVPQSRYIYYPDHLVRLPGPGMGLMDSVRALVDEPLLKDIPWSIAKEYFMPPAAVYDESVGSFFSRRFGPEVVNNLLSAAVHGIYAGDVWKLSMKSLVPQVQRLESIGGVTKGMMKDWKMRREIENKAAHPYMLVKVRDAKMIHALAGERDTMGRGFRSEFMSPFVYTLEGGLETLTKTLERYLKGNQNVRIKTNTAVSKIIPNNTPGQPHIKVRSRIPLLYPCSLH